MDTSSSEHAVEKMKKKRNDRGKRRNENEPRTYKHEALKESYDDCKTQGDFTTGQNICYNSSKNKFTRRTRASGDVDDKGISIPGCELKNLNRSCGNQRLSCREIKEKPINLAIFGVELEKYEDREQISHVHDSGVSSLKVLSENSENASQKNIENKVSVDIESSMIGKINQNDENTTDKSCNLFELTPEDVIVMEMQDGSKEVVDPCDVIFVLSEATEGEKRGTNMVNTVKDFVASCLAADEELIDGCQDGEDDVCGVKEEGCELEERTVSSVSVCVEEEKFAAVGQENDVSPDEIVEETQEEIAEEISLSYEDRTEGSPIEETSLQLDTVRNVNEKDANALEKEELKNINQAEVEKDFLVDEWSESALKVKEIKIEKEIVKDSTAFGWTDSSNKVPEKEEIKKIKEVETPKDLLVYEWYESEDNVHNKEEIKEIQQGKEATKDSAAYKDTDSGKNSPKKEEIEGIKEGKEVAEDLAAFEWPDSDKNVPKKEKGNETNQEEDVKDLLVYRCTESGKNVSKKEEIKEIKAEEAAKELLSYECTASGDDVLRKEEIQQEKEIANDLPAYRNTDFVDNAPKEEVKEIEKEETASDLLVYEWTDSGDENEGFVVHLGDDSVDNDEHLDLDSQFTSSEMELLQKVATLEAENRHFKARNKTLVAENRELRRQAAQVELELRVQRSRRWKQLEHRRKQEVASEAGFSPCSIV